MTNLKTLKLALVLLILLGQSPAALADKLAWHLPNMFSYHFAPAPQDATSPIGIKAPVEIKVSVRRTHGSGYPQHDEQLTGGIQRIETIVDGGIYETPIACLQNLRWPIQSIAIQQDAHFTVVLTRAQTITEPTQVVFLRVAIQHGDTAIQNQKAVTCERKKL